jgi:hypothetical protein
MATSGTATFTLDLVDLIDEAYERVGAEGARTGYDFRTARRSLSLLQAEWSNMGLNMFTFEQATIPLVPGTATYDLPADTVDLLEHSIRTGTGSNQTDIAVSRISISTYATIPNKNATGRPNQIFIERLDTPRFTLWPTPDASTPYTFVYWRMRRIQDPGTGVNTPDMPYRFLPCLVAGLAYYLALKVPGGLERLGVLQQQYREAMDLAMAEDREKSPVRFVPRMTSI